MAESTQISSGKPIKEKIPPIVLAGKPNDPYALHKFLTEKTKLDIESIPHWRTWKFRASNRKDHEFLVEEFKSAKIPHFTFPYKEDKKRRFVIHNLPATLKPDDILLDLKKTIPEVCNVKQMIKNDNENNEKINLPVFILTTLRCVTLKRFELIKKICSHKYRIQCYKANYRAIQCFRCQLFGHTIKFCNLNNKRCLRCGEFHSIKECTKTEPKCCNCSEKHVASYKKCSGRRNFEMKRGKPFEHAFYSEEDNCITLAEIFSTINRVLGINKFV